MKSLKFLPAVLGALAMLTVSVISQPQAQAQAPNHVFEYRKYYAMPGKLEDLKKRFRDHTIRIFNRHNMKSVGYWEAIDNKDNALIYILEHPSVEQGKKNWDAFRADPEWVKASKASEENGKLIDHVESVWMNPSDFSPMK
jgi:hypothetical protein